VTIQDALGLPQMRDLVHAIARQELNAAFGRRIVEAPAQLPTHPQDGSFVGALLSPPVVQMIRQLARDAAEKRKRGMKGVAEMQMRREGGRPSLDVLEATRGSGGAGGRRRLSRAATAFLSAREDVIESAAEVLPQPRTATGIWEALLPVRSDGEVLRSDGQGVLEAAVADVPLAERGWRERLSTRGVDPGVYGAMGERR
jgi:hypothetical protein